MILCNSMRKRCWTQGIQQTGRPGWVPEMLQIAHREVHLVTPSLQYKHGHHWGGMPHARQELCTLLAGPEVRRIVLDNHSDGMGDTAAKHIPFVFLLLFHPD